MSALGFTVTDAKPECDHRGTIETGNVCGYGIRQCSGCGRSWALVQLDDGSLGWVIVQEPREIADQPVVLVREGDREERDGDSLAHLGEDVFTVSGDKDNVRLLAQPDEDGRERPSVQGVPQGVERHLPAEGGEEAL